MSLLERIKFAFTYDFDRDFIVYSIPDQTAMIFLTFDDAKKYSDDQIQYRPKILISVRRRTKNGN